MKALFLKSPLLMGLCAIALTLQPAGTQAGDKFITVASTTSTVNSGLFDSILPLFTEQSGIEARVVAKGTGAAIRLARDGDADVLFVHHKPSEEKFVSEGYGIERLDVMYNDFVIVGPAADPAGIKGESDATKALSKIAGSASAFASRGDDSGTHKKELGLWKAANLTPEGDWYRPTGSGMGATLNTASAMNAYTMTDRGTWIAFENKGELKVLVEGDKRLFNQYGVIVVNPQKFAHIKADMAKTFVDWVISPEGQAAIAAYKRGGEQLFFPNAPNS